MDFTRRILRPARRAAVRLTLPVVGAALGGAACDTTGPEGRLVVVDFSFAQEDQGFEAGFTDYPAGREEDIDFVAEHRPLPPPLEGSALYHSGENISDDLFMFFKRRVLGLEPGRTYDATFRLEFASAIGEDCTIGVGTSVYLKAGAAAIEPMEVVQEGDVRLNIDKGNQANRGEAAVILGDIRNGEPGCDDAMPFALETVESGAEMVAVTADDAGGVWLFFGSESAFEVGHELFFTTFRTEFRRR